MNLARSHMERLSFFKSVSFYFSIMEGSFVDFSATLPKPHKLRPSQSTICLDHQLRGAASWSWDSKTTAQS
jgi:hypothetical protein